MLATSLLALALPADAVVAYGPDGPKPIEGSDTFLIGIRDRGGHDRLSLARRPPGSSDCDGSLSDDASTLRVQGDFSVR